MISEPMTFHVSRDAAVEEAGRRRGRVMYSVPS
jgi:hypothetical protein